MFPSVIVDASPRAIAATPLVILRLTKVSDRLGDSWLYRIALLTNRPRERKTLPYWNPNALVTPYGDVGTIGVVSLCGETPAPAKISPLAAFTTRTDRPVAD